MSVNSFVRILKSCFTFATQAMGVKNTGIACSLHGLTAKTRDIPVRGFHYLQRQRKNGKKSGKSKKSPNTVVLLYNFSYICPMRKIIAYKNYFSDFLEKLPIQEKAKLLRSLDLLTTEDKIPHHYVKFIRDGIYEFRSNYGNTEFRVFFINDGNRIVVLFNAFKKKTQKTPESEIKKAIKLKEEYYATKGNQQGHL